MSAFANIVGDYMEDKKVSIPASLVKDAQKKKEVERTEVKTKLLNQVKSIIGNTIIRVEYIDEDVYKVDKSNMLGEIYRLQLLSSKIREDIFDIKNSIQKIKTIQYAMASYIEEEARKRPINPAKTIKEVEQYIHTDRYYNDLEIELNRVQGILERTTSMSISVNTQIGFIRDFMNYDRRKYD